MKKEDAIWQQVYANYPINNNYIWMNNCGTTSAGNHIKEEMAHLFTDYAAHGIFSQDFNYLKIKQDVQEILGYLLNCVPDDIALIHNTAEGMNYISHGLNLQAGDEILLMENEYPSNVYPWQHWQKKRVMLKVVSVGNSPEEFYANLEKMLNVKTKVVALSAVHWCTGMPLPIKKIAEVCKKKNVLLALDAAQGAGHVPINISDWDIPFTVFSAWKWLLGPLGLGVLIIPQKYIQQIEPIFKGTDSVINSLEYLPYKDKLKPNVERFMISTANYSDWVYFRASLLYLKEIGFDKVMNRIYELARYLKVVLKKAGLNLYQDKFINQDKELESGIVVAYKEGVKSLDIVNQLKKHNVIAAERLGRIRFSPHIMNSFEQLDEIGEVIKKM